MKLFLPLFLLGLIAWPMAGAQASSAGLLLSDDSVEIDYRTNKKPFYRQETLQRFSLMYSQEPAPRNFLLRGDLEFIQHSGMLAKAYPLRPKIGLLALNTETQTISGIPLGAILRFPVSEKRPFDGLIEAFFSPLFGNAITNDWPTDYQLPWIMGMRMQINYPLPEDTEINFGYRNIRMKIDRDPVKTFEQGFFLGLTSHF